MTVTSKLLLAQTSRWLSSVTLTGQKPGTQGSSHVQEAAQPERALKPSLPCPVGALHQLYRVPFVKMRTRPDTTASQRYLLLARDACSCLTQGMRWTIGTRVCLIAGSCPKESISRNTQARQTKGQVRCSFPLGPRMQNLGPQRVSVAVPRNQGQVSKGHPVPLTPAWHIEPRRCSRANLE